LLPLKKWCHHERSKLENLSSRAQHIRIKKCHPERSAPEMKFVILSAAHQKICHPERSRTMRKAHGSA
jgi:hypothetical protein